jgi:hypothetical protein
MSAAAPSDLGVSEAAAELESGSGQTTSPCPRLVLLRGDNLVKMSFVPSGLNCVGPDQSSGLVQ